MLTCPVPISFSHSLSLSCEKVKILARQNVLLVEHDIFVLYGKQRHWANQTPKRTAATFECNRMSYGYDRRSGQEQRKKNYLLSVIFYNDRVRRQRPASGLRLLLVYYNPRAIFTFFFWFSERGVCCEYVLPSCTCLERFCCCCRCYYYYCSSEYSYFVSWLLNVFID